jgi:erythromycin esterase-like protein
MENIINLLRQNKNHSLEDEIYIRYIAGMAINCSRIKEKEITNERLHIRDSIMAENIIWLVNNVFPNEKIIVWAANVHILYNNKMYTSQKESITYTGFTSMGEYLKKEYKDSCYMLCFTSFANLNSRNILSNKGNTKCLEYLLHKQDYQYAFIDFNSLDSNSFLNKELTLKTNQNLCISAQWSKMLDGLFFIDTMKNATYNK